METVAVPVVGQCGYKIAVALAGLHRNDRNAFGYQRQLQRLVLGKDTLLLQPFDDGELVFDHLAQRIGRFNVLDMQGQPVLGTELNGGQTENADVLLQFFSRNLLKTLVDALEIGSPDNGPHLRFDGIVLLLHQLGIAMAAVWIEVEFQHFCLDIVGLRIGALQHTMQTHRNFGERIDRMVVEGFAGIVSH